MKRNPMAKRDIELARLKKVTEQSYITDEVRANGFGAVDMQRLERAIDQVGIGFKFATKPKAAAIFTVKVQGDLEKIRELGDGDEYRFARVRTSPPRGGWRRR